jgi:phage anti-repressor protein
MEFSHELAIALLQSSDPFPIDFDDAWQWIGYSSKQKARNKLFHNFEPEIDYTVLLTHLVKQTGRGGHNREQISLTIDCFKSLAMMAGTSKGKEVRQYFLKCERIAKQAVEIIPAQTQEIERLKLELELAKTQERLLATTSAITTLHGTEMVALILGKPDAIITKTERVETVVTVDNKGKAIAQFDGVGITYLAKRYGFGSNTKACRYWLESIGIGSSEWLTEPTLIKSQKLPRSILPKLDAQYAARTGVRQRLIGE